MAGHVDSDIFRIPPRPPRKGHGPTRQPAIPKPSRRPLPRTAKASASSGVRPSPQAPATDEDFRSARRSMFRDVPAWAVSALVHIVAILMMALFVSETATLIEKLTFIAAPPSEEEIEDDPIKIPEMDDALPEIVEPVAESTVPDGPVLGPLDLGEVIPDIPPSPPIEFDDEFGEQTAPASGMLDGLDGGGPGTGLLDSRTIGRQRAPPMCEQAIDGSLKWIALHQLPDGGWSFDLTACPSCMGQCSHSGTSKKDDRAGATAMAMLPFLGRGYTHREGPYQKQVEGGVAFLVQQAMQNKGKVYGPSGSLYSQGLAGIALSECYAMSQDQRLAAPTQLVLNFIMDAQDPQGGGWRYTPRQPGDTSAVGWQIMALKSGNLAYLDVNPLTIKKAVEFLDSVQSDYGAAYGYLDASNPTLARSSVGLLCRMYLGWKKDHEGLQEGARRIAQAGPSKDLYYDYYATQIMHHLEGERWVAWNATMTKMLLESQATKDHEAGSWYAGVDVGHGAHAAGRLYCTSLATMILEVYYRHLPIYGTQSVDEEFPE